MNQQVIPSIKIEHLAKLFVESQKNLKPCSLVPLHLHALHHITLWALSISKVNKETVNILDWTAMFCIKDWQNSHQ